MASESVGIPQLDRQLQSIPRGSAVALLNDPGVDPDPFLYQCAAAREVSGDTVLYTVFTRPPSAVLRGMKDYGFNIQANPRTFKFIDAYSALTGGDEGATVTLRDPRDPSELGEVIPRLAKQHPGAVFLIDGLSALLDLVPADGLLDMFRQVRPSLARFRLTLASLTRWPYGPEFDELTRLFDGAVSLKAVEDRVVVNQYFRVDRAKWARRLEPRPILYRTHRPGGVLAYIPKILITGPYHAGKSTLIQTLSDTATSVNRLGTTVAMDHGHLTIDGLSVDLFGSPGQERFDPLLKTLAGQALGVVLVVDSTDPETFLRARTMLRQAAHEGLPTIVAANKQGDPKAMSPQEVAQALDLPPHVLVVGCDARKKDQAWQVLKTLLDRIMFQVAA